MRFRLLGTLQVSVGDGHVAPLGGHRQRLVLAVLLLHAGRAVSVDLLVDQVWGERPPPTARKTLQTYVSRLRRILQDDDLLPVRDGYVLTASADEIDAARFERLAAEGRRLLDRDPAAAGAALREALSLWRGAPWGELADEPALRSEAERLRELKLTALEDRLTADVATDSGPVIGELRGLVDEHPLRERLRGLLMVALYREGRTAEALAVYEQGRVLLADELGADPGPDLQSVHQRILQGDATLLGATRRRQHVAAEAPTHNPYKGLSAFGEDDEEDFFGRDGLVQELLDRVSRSPFVVLVGPSGGGKSSAVRAGLVPALRAGALDGSDRWRIAVMVPGAHPFAQLEAALLRASATPADDLSAQLRGDDLDLLRAALRVVPEDRGQLVLVIDQLEELFVQVADEEQRDRFLRNLVEAAEDPHSRLRVVAVLRADLLDRPMAHARFGPLLVDGLLHVLPLTPAELEAACVAPAARVGVTVEPELAAELVAEVANRPGALPLFQYTMTELFERRAGSTLALHDYRGLGGVQGVVARRAEQTFQPLDDAAQVACRHVFLRLVALGDEGEVGRRRASRVELDGLVTDHTAVETVLDCFGAARLLAFGHDASSGQATVEVAHEALLRAWPRLAGWIEDSRSDLRVQRSVAAAAAEWLAAGRDDDYLLSGAPLQMAADWRGRDTAASAAERELVEASLARRARERADEQARQRRELDLERRAARRLRLLVGVLAVATLIAGALGGAAMVQRARAQEQTAAARAATELMRARQLASAAVATRQIDAELSMLLALHAVHITGQSGIPIPEEQIEALHWAVQAAGVAYPGDPPVTAAVGPQGPQGMFLLPLDELVALARANVQRELTDEECALHLGLASCPTLPATLPPLPTTPVTTPAAGPQPLAGTRVVMASAIVDPQAQGLRAELETLGERTGIDVQYIPSEDFDATLEEAVEGSARPDVAIVPHPTVVASLARDGKLIDLSGYLEAERLRTAFSDHLVSLVTVGDDGTWPADEGGVYALPFKVVSKSTVWYSIPAFEDAGYEIPSSYEDLLALTRRIAADGITPWCHGEESGGSSGWPGTDLIENLLLNESPAAYDAWLRHDIGFDSPPLRRAFGRMAELLLEPGHVVGGQTTAATQPWASASGPLFADPPRCLLYPLASFAPIAFPFGVQVGRDIGVFPFPPLEAGQDPVVVGGGDFAMALTDRPEVREVMRFLSGRDFGRQWALIDPSFISARSDFPADAYVPDPLRTAVAPSLTEALQHDRFRFDGSDMLPHEMGFDPMWQAMVQFTGAGPDNLDRLLADLDATWDEREEGSSR